ncbi:MAG: hypothetical protein RL419_697 [Actinomycetota bacterium]|jgi:hypothetical protein
MSRPALGTVPTPDERITVERLLGRRPQGEYRIVVRSRNGDPVVLRNAPLLDDGTPMPTLYWLIGPDEIKEVGAIEAEGGVNRVEELIGLEIIDRVHREYERIRDIDIPEHHTGPRPRGGVGGTRRGVKCLHAHFAWWLAGGIDPVGAWVDEQCRLRGATLAERVTS